MQGVETGVVPLGQAHGLFERAARAVREVNVNENGVEFVHGLSGLSLQSEAGLLGDNFL
jgi:hypothetical protein